MTHENAFNKATSTFIHSKKMQFQEEKDKFLEIKQGKSPLIQKDIFNKMEEEMDEFIKVSDLNVAANAYLNSKYDRTVATINKDSKILGVLSRNTHKKKTASRAINIFMQILGFRLNRPQTDSAPFSV